LVYLDGGGVMDKSELYLRDILHYIIAVDSKLARINENVYNLNLLISSLQFDKDSKLKVNIFRED
jgi:hypothetical protein